MSVGLDILVAEDNPDDVYLLREAFKRSGLRDQIYAVCDGLQTQAYLKGEDMFADRVTHPFPDLLLLDLNMPRMNGFEVLEWIRQDNHCHRMVVHVLTASSRPDDVARAYELHANSYTVKPTRLEGLVAFGKALHEWTRMIRLPAKPVTLSMND